MTEEHLITIAKQLWTLIEEGECVAWVGAGLSEPAGYPGWRDTIDCLCSACSVTPLDAGEQSEKSFMIKAEECKVADSGSYFSTLADLFGKPVTVTRQAFNLLMRIPFRAYVTTNFDPLLAMAGAMHDNRNLLAYPSLPPMELGGDSHPIYYLHGLARRGNSAVGENLVLAQDDFEEAYRDHVRMLLDPLLTYYPIVFLGCGLTEPAIRESFRRVHEILLKIEHAHPGIIRPRRYVLLPLRYRRILEDGGSERTESDKDRERDEEKRFGEMGIKVLRYNPRDESQHYEIEQVLEILCKYAEKPIALTPRIGLGQEITP